MKLLANQGLQHDQRNPYVLPEINEINGLRAMPDGPRSRRSGRAAARLVASRIDRYRMTVPVAFRQSDVTRLIRGAVKAGVEAAAIRLTVAPDGTLSLSVQRPADNDDQPGDSWDDA